jgi:hypothetical protein
MQPVIHAVDRTVFWEKLESVQRGGVKRKKLATPRDVGQRPVSERNYHMHTALFSGVARAKKCA